MAYGFLLLWMYDGRPVPWALEKIQMWPWSSIMQRRVVVGVVGLLVEQDASAAAPVPVAWS